MPKIASGIRRIELGMGQDVVHPDTKPSLEVISEIVNALNCSENPEITLFEMLDCVQRQQQQRFAALSEAARSDPWIKTRHEEILRNNQALHDAALEVLRTMRKTSFVA